MLCLITSQCLLDLMDCLVCVRYHECHVSKAAPSFHDVSSGELMYNVCCRLTWDPLAAVQHSLLLHVTALPSLVAALAMLQLVCQPGMGTRLSCSPLLTSLKRIFTTGRKSVQH